MRWFKTTKDLRSSLYAMFNVSTAVAPPVDDAQTMDTIREAMLELAEQEPGARSATLTRRIRYATDLQALWFMRGELMGVLAQAHGEMMARQKVDEVSEMFEGLLPRGLRSRPSPLSGPSYRDSRPHSEEI